MLQKLGIDAVGNPRISVTITKRKNKQVLHINFCNWLLVGFYKEPNGLSVGLPLIESEEIKDYPVTYRFSQHDEELKINFYRVPMEDIIASQDLLKPNYERTLEHIKLRFENYKKSPWRAYHVDQIESAIFNENEREELFLNGLDVGELSSGEDVQYFWLTANPTIWTVEKIKNGDAVFYTAFNEKGNKRRIFHAFELAQPGDKILFYESTPRKEVVAIGEVVEGLHKQDELGFDGSVEGVSFRFTRDIKPISWSQIIEVEELKDAAPIKNGAQGSLFQLTQEEYETILALEGEEVEVVSQSLPAVDFSTQLAATSLHFEDEALILKQVQLALKSGKHIILTGPPGTGKSKLAKEICKSYGVDYHMTTATSDWSTYETIGGYRPEMDGTLAFKAGLVLQSFKDANTYERKNEWLIIDEMNRADIDKAFGALFSALTGDPVTLSFTAESGKQVVIRPEASEEVGKNDYEYIVPKDWRLIGTMNTFDKASLYEMSYAFMRRFAFIPVGIPKKITSELIGSYLGHWGIKDYSYVGTLVEVWRLINEYRQIGPAIVEDLAKFSEEDGDFTSAIILYVMPQFEGLLEHEIKGFVSKVGQLQEVDEERLLSFAYDFFQIKE